MAIKLKKTDFVRSLVKNHKLAGDIDKAIGRGEFEWSATFGPKVGDLAWHPSGDCVPSALALYAKAQAVLAQEAAQKPSVSLSKTFQVGHFWHAYIQHIVVEKLGYATWDDIERRGMRVWGNSLKTDDLLPIPENYGAKPFHWATGSADIAPCHLPVHGDYLVDIKTMGAHDFKQMGLPSWCAPKYECQVNIYMDWFDLERAIILCVSKDSPHEFKEYEYERNQPLIETIYGKWGLVGACVEQNEPPPEDYEVELPFVGPRL